MKTRTSFKLNGKEGIVHCWTGTLKNFIEDIEEFILPILENYIIAEFNDAKIIIQTHDTAESIYNNFIKEFNKLK